MLCEGDVVFRIHKSFWCRDLLLVVIHLASLPQVGVWPPMTLLEVEGVAMTTAGLHPLMIHLLTLLVPTALAARVGLVTAPLRLLPLV